MEMEDLSNIEWRKIVKCPGLYVSNEGHIYKSRIKRITMGSNCDGYRQTSYLGKNYCVHRLVAQAFLNDYSESLTVNHKNKIRFDNRVSNLEMMTHSENKRHGHVNPCPEADEKNAPFLVKNNKDKSKLTEIIQIRVSEYEKNRIKHLAEMYSDGNVSLWVIHCCLNGPRKQLEFDEMDHSGRKKKGKIEKKGPSI